MLNEDDFKKQAISKDETFIAQAMNYLKYVDPQHATHHDAVSFLEFMQTVGEQAAKVTSLDFETFYKEYKKQVK